MRWGGGGGGGGRFEKAAVSTAVRLRQPCMYKNQHCIGVEEGR